VQQVNHDAVIKVQQPSEEEEGLSPSLGLHVWWWHAPSAEEWSSSSCVWWGMRVQLTYMNLLWASQSASARAARLNPLGLDPI
jgi:hypothetical protein